MTRKTLSGDAPMGSSRHSEEKSPALARDSNVDQSEKSDVIKLTTNAPDGGWGWMVVVGAFLTSFLIGLMFIFFSIIYIEFVEYFRADSAVIGWVGSLYLAVGNCVGILFGVLVKRFGCRRMAICGSMLWSLAIGSSSFSKSIFSLYITYGILGGCGFNIVLIASVVIVQEYFDKRRALAAGISAAGISVGSLTAGPISRYLLDEYNWQGTLLIVSGFLLNGIVAGALYRPVASNYKRKENCPSPEIAEHEAELDDIVSTISAKTFDTKTRRSRRMRKVIEDVLNPTLFRNINFTLFCVGTLFMNFGLLTLYQHTPSRAAYLGVDKSRVSIIPAFVGASMVISRLAFGWMANMPCTNRTLQYALSVLIAGILTTGCVLFRTFIAISIYGVLQGTAVGCCLTVQSTVLVDLVGVDQVAKAHGLLYMFVGTAGLLSVPFAGFLFDITRNYDIPFYVNGSIQMIGSFFLLAVWWRRQKKR